MEYSTEACGGRLLWFRRKIDCFLFLYIKKKKKIDRLFSYSVSWVLRGITSGVQLQTSPWQQNKQVSGCVECCYQSFGCLAKVLIARYCCMLTKKIVWPLIVLKILLGVHFVQDVYSWFGVVDTF